ncbi:outer membrane beta-barrel protein [Proteobacteria bacterium 005FR1]|nr:outer membrane beta-barrel protein [Proteobacteria bacterium 005FR1]
MRKLLTTSVALSTLLVLTGPAFAEIYDFAIEGSLGKSDQTNSIDGFDAIGGYGDSKAFRGLFAINSAMHLELGYTDFGTAEDSSVDAFGDLLNDYLDTTAAQVGIRGTIPLGKKLALMGRAGVALWELDYRQTDSAFPGEVYRDADEGSDPYFGAGLQLRLQDNLRLGVEYNVLDFTAKLGDASTDQEISSFAVSLGYAF